MPAHKRRIYSVSDGIDGAVRGLWFYAVKQDLRAEPNIDRRFVRDASLWTLSDPVAYVVATACVFLSPRLSAALYAVIPIVYLLPAEDG